MRRPLAQLLAYRVNRQPRLRRDLALASALPSQYLYLPMYSSLVIIASSLVFAEPTVWPRCINFPSRYCVIF